MEIGPQAKSDNKFTRKYRKLQSEYRANILRVPFGFGPTKNSNTKYGNMLINGEKTGHNFISNNAFMFAKQKALDKQINKDLTLDEYRLFNNMLSSMPMCFNLFSDLRSLLLDNQKEVSAIVKTMFKELPWIDKVLYIDVEFIPIPTSAYIDDKSAFDAMILVEDENGKKGLISIETKYTDLLGNNTSSKTSLKDEIITKNKIFDTELVKHIKEKGYKQIHRNYLLTYMFAKKNKFTNFSNVIISPKDDSISVKEIADLHSHLLQKKDTILKITLEDIIDRGSSSPNKLMSDTMTKFKNRYLEK